MKPKSPTRKSVILLILSNLMMFLTLLGGIIEMLQKVSLIQFFSEPVISNYRYTFMESVFEFDKTVGEFWNNIIFSLLIVAFVIKNSEILRDFKEGRVKKKYSSTLVKISIIITVLWGLIILLGSIFNFGLDRPYLDGKTWKILFYNFYPQHASDLICTWVILITGFPNLICRIIQGPSVYIYNKNHEYQNRIARTYILSALIIMNILLAVYPIEFSYIFSSNALVEIFFMFFESVIIICLLFLIQSKFSTRNDTNGGDFERERMKFNVEPVDKKPVWLKYKHMGLIQGLISITIFIIISTGFIYFLPYSDFGPFILLQRCLTTISRIFLSTSLFSFFFSLMKRKNAGGDK